MAGLPELEDALRNAHAAGDTAAAQQLADEILRQRESAAAPATQPTAAPMPPPAAQPAKPGFMEQVGGAVQAVRQNPVVDATIQVPFGAAKGAAEVAMLPLTVPQLAKEGADYSIKPIMGAGLDAGENLVRSIFGMQPLGPEEQARRQQAADEAQKRVDAINPVVQIPNAVRGLIEMLTPKAQTPSGRISNRISQEVGAMAVPVGYGINKAKVGIEALREAPTVLSRMFAEPAAVGGAKALLQRELPIATGAGAGAAATNAFVGTVNPQTGQYEPGWADLFGALGGAGATGLTRSIAGPVGTMASAVMGKPKFIDGVVRDVSVDEIARAAGAQPNARGVIDTGPLASEIDAGRRVSDVVPGFQETLADRTRNAGLAALEYSRQSGDNAGLFTNLRNANTKAVDAALLDVKPQGQPGAMRETLEAERNRQLTDIIMQAQKASDDAAAAARAAQPGMADATTRGSVARSALQDAADAAKAKVDEAYRPINEATVPVDVAPLAERFSAITENLPVNDRQRFLPAEARVPQQLVEPAVPPTPSPILGPDGVPIMREGAPASSEVPLKEITSIRSGLSQDQRTAQAAGEAQRGRVAGQFQGEVNQFLDQNMPAELRQQYNDATAARRDFADRFERPGTALQRVLQRREGGGYQLDDSGVTRHFTPTDQGNLTDFRDALREAGKDTRLRSAIADEVASEAQRMGVIDKPDAMRQFLSDRSIVLNEFPELRARLGAVADTTEKAGAARAAQGEFERGYGTPEKPGSNNVGRYLQYSDAKSDSAMTEILRAKDPAKAADDVMNFARNDPKAVEGIRTSFWNRMEGQSRRSGETTATLDGIQPWMPGKLKQFLDDPANAAVAERLYRDNPEHLKRIREIADAIQGVDVRNSAKAPNTSGTPQGLQSGHLPSGETLASRIFAVERGVVSPAFAALNIAGIMARKATKSAQIKAVNMAIDRALTDPDWAAALLRENNPANRAALRQNAKGWLGNETSTLVDLLTSGGENDEVKDTIMRDAPPRSEKPKTRDATYGQ